VLNDKQLIKRIIEESQGTRLVVFTGGEPLCQPIVSIVPALKAFGFCVGIETNGTIETDPLCFISLSLSPKIPFRQCKVPRCHSLKLLYPYLNGVTPEDYKMMYAGYKFIQPIWFEGDVVRTLQVQQEAAEEVMRIGNGWRLGLQMHKFINLK
jgi:organic radical activating enzyme